MLLLLDCISLEGALGFAKTATVGSAAELQCTGGELVLDTHGEKRQHTICAVETVRAWTLDEWHREAVPNSAVDYIKVIHAIAAPIAYRLSHAGHGACHTCCALWPVSCRPWPMLYQLCPMGYAMDFVAPPMLAMKYDADTIMEGRCRRV